jgi:hypothetical protein
VKLRPHILSFLCHPLALPCTSLAPPSSLLTPFCLLKGGEKKKTSSNKDKNRADAVVLVAASYESVVPDAESRSGSPTPSELSEKAESSPFSSEEEQQEEQEEQEEQEQEQKDDDDEDEYENDDDDKDKSDSDSEGEEGEGNPHAPALDEPEVPSTPLTPCTPTISQTFAPDAHETPSETPSFQDAAAESPMDLDPSNVTDGEPSFFCPSTKSSHRHPLPPLSLLQSKNMTNISIRSLQKR